MRPCTISTILCQTLLSAKLHQAIPEFPQLSKGNTHRAIPLSMRCLMFCCKRRTTIRSFHRAVVLCLREVSGCSQEDATFAVTILFVCSFAFIAFILLALAAPQAAAQQGQPLKFVACNFFDRFGNCHTANTFPPGVITVVVDTDVAIDPGTSPTLFGVTTSCINGVALQITGDTGINPDLVDGGLNFCKGYPGGNQFLGSFDAQYLAGTHAITAKLFQCTCSLPPSQRRRHPVPTSGTPGQ